MQDLHNITQITIEQWEHYWAIAVQANLLQSWQYGEAKKEAEGWNVYRFLFSDKNNQPVALIQILARTLPFLGGIARVNRGPLLLEKLSEKEDVACRLGVLQALFLEARRRHWWLVQIAPELPDTQVVRNSLQSLGMHHRPKVPWASGRMDLHADEESLLMHVKGKWRNCMRKGLRLGVEVLRHEGSGPELNQLIDFYKALQITNNFEGISESLLRGLARQKGLGWQFNLFIAYQANFLPGDKPLGILVSIQHGDTCMYLIGASNDQGRKMQANSVLLWQAVLHAKRAGCNWFDIGGLNASTPSGVAKFKQGLNAEPYELVGEWRWFCYPWLRLLIR